MDKKTKTVADDRASGALDAAASPRGSLLKGADVPPRLRVAKAYKMYVGGAFVRSESARYLQVRSSGAHADADPDVVNVPRASRKDVRDAVLVARNAQHGWAARTPFNRGQILYRLAEVLESRRAELVESLVRSGTSPTDAVKEVDASVDRAIFYAGFADKVSALVASHNPVSGPHFGFSLPEPVGVVAVVAPPRPSLLGLLSTVVPPVVGGSTVVALASHEDPRTAVVFTECLATSDLPGGVINVLTGLADEVAPALAKHREVDAFDGWIVDADLRKAIAVAGADNVKRVRTHVPMDESSWLDETRGQGLTQIEAFLETKTIWHPVGV